MTLETSIEYLKGIGPERAKLIKNVLGISTVEDFLTFYPNRYIDRSKVHAVQNLSESSDIDIQLRGKITQLQEIAYGKSQKRLTAKFTDGTGCMDLVWFRYSKWMKEQIPQNRELFIFGKIHLFNGNFSMPHPEIEVDEKKALFGTLLPIYPTSEKLSKRGINNKFFQNTIYGILKILPELTGENLPEELMSELKLMPRLHAFYNIHFPKNIQLSKEADKRIKFEEAFFFQLGYGLKKQHQHSKSVGHPFKNIGHHFKDFYAHHLPFELTNAQKRVIK